MTSRNFGHHMVMCSDGQIRSARYGGWGCGEFVVISGVELRNGDSGISWEEDEDEDEDDA
jgi:hypothetical protein